LWRGEIDQTPVKKSKYWFTTDTAILLSTGEKIFVTPKDYGTSAHSFESAFE